MKTIGRTEDGEVIVIMTQDEHNVLGNLAGASQGWSHLNMRSPREYVMDYDLTRPLERVIAFTQTQQEVAALLNLVSHINDTLAEMGESHV